MRYKIFFAMLLICFSSSQVLGQDILEDIIYFKNGTVLRGQVMEHEPNGYIKIEIYGESVLVYKSSEILKVEKGTIKVAKEIKETKKVKRPNHKVPNTGVYGTFAFGTLIGLESLKKPTSGISFKGVAGWYFHRLLGVGAGVGIVNLNLRGPLFIPFFANIRGNFMKSTASLFYDVNIGYAIGMTTPSYYSGGPHNTGSIDGGLYLRPSLGVRFPSKRKTHIFLDVGCVIQFASIQHRAWGSNGTNHFVDKTIFYRPSLRIGLTL